MTEGFFDRTLQVIQSQEVFDLHTHLFPANFQTHCLWGVDELLCYHYLIAEFLRSCPVVSPEEFYAWPMAKRADEIWQALFVERTPISEATAGVITVFNALGLNAHSGSLREARTYFADVTVSQQIDQVLHLAGVNRLCMTNDPHDADEVKNWLDGSYSDSRFVPVLRMDQILKKGDASGDRSPVAVRAYIDEWVRQMNPAYMGISLGPDFAYPSRSAAAQFISECVIPAARDHGLPFAMMIGAKRAINPRLQAAGDGSGRMDVSSVQNLAAAFPEVNFLITTLARENAHEIAILSRKFANLKPFGCWWFLNNPSIIEEITDFRLEMLGTEVIPQHSDARILEQLIYKWRHSRRIIAKSLAKRYDALSQNGYAVTQEQIGRDAATLLQSNAQKWIKAV